MIHCGLKALSQQPGLQSRCCRTWGDNFLSRTFYIVFTSSFPRRWAGLALRSRSNVDTVTHGPAWQLQNPTLFKFYLNFNLSSNPVISSFLWWNTPGFLWYGAAFVVWSICLSPEGLGGFGGSWHLIKTLLHNHVQMGNSQSFTCSWAHGLHLHGICAEPGLWP